MTQTDFLLLFQCIIDFGAELVRDLVTGKILKKYQKRLLKDFLKIAKHHMYHQMAANGSICCRCPSMGPNIRKTGYFSSNIFEKFFAYFEGQTCSSKIKRRNGEAGIDICICKYSGNDIDFENLDLSDLKSLCLNSSSPSFLTSQEENQLDVLINIRNKVCHAINSNMFSKPELNIMWTDVSKALCCFSSIDQKYLTMMIKDKRQKALNETIIQELLLKVNNMQKDAQVRIDQTNTLTNVVRDMKTSQERQENENKKFQEQVMNSFGKMITEVENVKFICSMSTSADASKSSKSAGASTASTSADASSASQDPLAMEADIGKEIDIKMKLKNIDEHKMRACLETETLSDKKDEKDGWKWVTVKRGCILLEVKTLPDTFSNEQILNLRMQALVKRVLQAGKVNTSEKAEIVMDLNIKSPVTIEEEKNIRTVFSVTSKLQKDSDKKLLDYQTIESEMEASKGGTEEMEDFEIRQNNSEEYIECPKCLHNFKCSQCASKLQTIRKMRSEFKRDSIQVQKKKGHQLVWTEEDIADDPCDVCGFKDADDGNEMVYCEGCNVLVHQACYNIPTVPDGDWFCRPCVEGVQPTCVLCKQDKGAMVKTSDGRTWVHVQCVWWLPDINFKDGKKMEKLESLEKISKKRWMWQCCLCKREKGACIQCCEKGCFKSFHSRCAFQHKLRMQTIDSPVLEFKPYCEEHSKTTTPKQKDDKRRRRRAGLRKRLIAEEGSKTQSEPQKKKRKVRGNQQ